jgi:hypothetical protein
MRFSARQTERPIGRPCRLRPQPSQGRRRRPHRYRRDYGNLIDTNLAVVFRPDNTVLLTLDGLEYAIQACGADLWEGPITDLKPYLALTAADYFPVLRN